MVISEERSERRLTIQDSHFGGDLFACPDAMLEDDIAHQLWNNVDKGHAGKALRPINHRALSEARLADEECPILPQILYSPPYGLKVP